MSLKKFRRLPALISPMPAARMGGMDAKVRKAKARQLKAKGAAEAKGKEFKAKLWQGSVLYRLILGQGD